jgi:hypothetical protein
VVVRLNAGAYLALAYMKQIHFLLYRRYNFGWSHGKEKLESGKLGKDVSLFC